MDSSLVKPCTPSVPICTALLAILTLLLSGWTCRIQFDSCQGVGSHAQLSSLSPSRIPSDTNSVPLTVEGNGFTPQSQITWNGSTLETAFVDSHHIQTTITQETFEAFGGSGGNNVQISVETQGGSGCPVGGHSASLKLGID